MPNLKKLESELRAGRISRREFVKTASLLGLAVVVPGALNTAHAAPKKGGKFTVGFGHGSTTDSLDPGTYENDFMINSSYNRYNFLTEIDNKGNLVGELAKSWDVTKDAKTWTFKLRKGVEFQDGKSLTPADVISSINHHRGDKSTSAVKDQVAPIKSIKADGDRVVFTLKDGDADFPFTLSDYHLPIMKDNGGKADWKSNIGTGAYITTAFDPGVRMAYTRNPNYWKKKRGNFDEVEVITIADVGARTNALATGEIDFMDRPDLKTLHLLARNKKLKIEEIEGNGHYSIPMRTNLSPFDDNHVRLALKYGVDREALLKTVLRGHGYVGNDHPIGKGQRYFNTKLKQRQYDPDKAKFHLKKAGLSNLKVQLKSADAAFAGAVDAAVLYKEHASKAGIDIEVVRVPNDGYWSNVWNVDNCNWCFCYWGGRPTENEMFTVAYAAGANWNDASWKHSRFNELLKIARSEVDESKRSKMYGEMQQIVSDEGGTVVPVFNNFIHVISKKVAHAKRMSSNWANDGQRFIERWWFA